MGDQQDPTQLAMAQYASASRPADRRHPARSTRRPGPLTPCREHPTSPTTGVMVAICCPAVQAGRRSGTEGQSQNNLKMIGLAMHNSLAAKNQFRRSGRIRQGGPPAIELAGRDLALPARCRRDAAARCRGVSPERAVGQRAQPHADRRNAVRVPEPQSQQAGKQATWA